MKKFFRIMCGLVSTFAFTAAVSALNSACFATYYQPETSPELDEYRR